MSEAFLEQLSRFTPNAGGLDRDALLFVAGRGSARPNRGWVTAASLLAGAQALSLLVLWPRPAPPAVGHAPAVALAPETPTIPDRRTAEAWANPRLMWARHGLLGLETEDRPTGDATLIESGPPLRAAGPLPPSLLN